MLSQTYELDRIILVDNVLGPAGNWRKSRTHEFRTTHKHATGIESRVCAHRLTPLSEVSTIRQQTAPDNVQTI